MATGESRVRRFVRGALFAGLAGFALAGAATTAQAVPLTGTFTISVYNGNGGGTIASPGVQANTANPLIIPADLLGTGTYTGSLNFNEGSGGTDTVGAFLATGAGVLSAGLTTPAVSNAFMTSAPFATTTVFVITGDLGGTTDAGNITHDDGIGLYDGVSYATLLTPVGAEAPTVATSTAYAGLTGQFKLVFVQTNGLPSVLNFDVTHSQEPPPVPLPPGFPLFVTALAGLGFAAWRGRGRLSGSDISAG